MGGVSTKEEIIARLDELDRKELALNIQLRDLQKQLNDIVPDEEKVKVNENLGREDDIAEINEVGNSNKRNKMKENTKRSQNQKTSKDFSFADNRTIYLNASFVYNFLIYFRRVLLCHLTALSKKSSKQETQLL